MNSLQRLHNKILLFNSASLGDDNNSRSNFNRTYTIKVVGAVSGIGSYQIFGYNIGTFVNLDRQPTVQVLQSSVENVNRDMANNPFTTISCKYKTNNNNNFFHPIFYSKQDSTGLLVRQEFSPYNYLEPDNATYESFNQLITIPDFKGLVFDGSYAITGQIEELSEIVFVLTLQTKVNRSGLLCNQKFVDKNNIPAPGTVNYVELKL